ncbi:hypothetical protein U9Z00_16980 [Escherichia coli]|uniref:hypothetical protein n=1 Tax=Escherichia coli TaxID=562 RepID=UPI001FCF15C6|nr:hypothetical protein [Escherichia coli]MCZ0250716.1 hypothetical protein [Escherichia coli]MDL5420301.1 hypothetical protein [Escherichia coli]MED7809406.1 hypothetical protein [Escherichia coli]
MAVIYVLAKSPLMKSGGQLHWNIDSPLEQQPLKIVNGRLYFEGGYWQKDKSLPMSLLKLNI